MSLHFTSPPIYNRSGLGEDGVFIPEVTIDDIVLWGSASAILENLDYLSNQIKQESSSTVVFVLDNYYSARDKEISLIQQNLYGLNYNQISRDAFGFYLYGFDIHSINLLSSKTAFNYNLFISQEQKVISGVSSLGEVFVEKIKINLNKIVLEVEPIIYFEEFDFYQIINFNINSDVEYLSYENKVTEIGALHKINLYKKFAHGVYSDLFPLVDLLLSNLEKANLNSTVYLGKDLLTLEKANVGLQNYVDYQVKINKGVVFGYSFNLGYSYVEKYNLNYFTELLMDMTGVEKHKASFVPSLALRKTRIEKENFNFLINNINSYYSERLIHATENIGYLRDLSYSYIDDIYVGGALSNKKIEYNLDKQNQRGRELNFLNLLNRNKLTSNLSKNDTGLENIDYEEFKNQIYSRSTVSYSSTYENRSNYFSSNFYNLNNISYGHLPREEASSVSYKNRLDYLGNENSKEYGENRVSFPSGYEYPKIIYSSREPNYELPDNSPTTGLIVYEGVENNNLYFYKPDENYMNWKYFEYGSRDGVFDPCEFSESADRTLDPLQVSSLSNRGDNPFWYLPGLLTVDSNLHTADGAPCLFISEERDRNFSIDLENGSGPLLPENNHQTGQLVVFSK